MSGVQVTPGKRKTGPETASTPTSARKEKAKAVPTPNPPLAPFPTPPATRHRKDRLPDQIPQPVFTPSDNTPENVSPPPPPPRITLPPHLQTLLTLHHAYNLALSLHIATHPPVLPPHSPSATKVDLANITNFFAIKETVERSSGRRFGLPELGRLAWLWSWNGERLPDDKLVSARQQQVEEDNPFLVPSGELHTSKIRVEGLSYLITPTRTLDGNGRKVHTYGLGFELDLKPGETRQILHGGNEGGLSNRGQGGGTAAIGRWSAGGEGRQDVVRERLERWVELNGGWESPLQTSLPTPSTSGSSRSNIPPIPLLPLPHLASSTLLPSANLFSSKLENPSPTLVSSPKKLALADPFVLDEKPKGKVMHAGSVEERKQAMMDRMKARSGSSNVPTLGSAVRKLDSIRPRMSAAEQQEALKRRSTLSRLEGVAEGVWMMFSAPLLGPSSLPTPPRGRRRAIPLAEAADVIVKSSKTPISTAEAVTSLQMLTELCPFFLTTKTVARKEWLEMPSAAVQAACPPSPSRLASPRDTPRMASSPSSRTVLEPPSSPTPGSRRTTMVPKPPVSPTPDSRRGTMMPKPPVSPTPSKRPDAELVGAGSPGRVRRVGGLREVRERIRRALGE